MRTGESIGVRTGVCPCRTLPGTFCIVLAGVMGWAGGSVCFAQVGGVYVDAKGVVREAATLDADERLQAMRTASAEAPSSRELATPSKLRKVSLRRLETEVARLLEEGQPLPADLSNLAGLIHLRHVFFYPEEGDVVLAGPAEGWTQIATGEVVGQRSQRPVLQLDDLIHALRFSFHEQPIGSFIGCSIEPTAEGMQRYVGYMRSLGGQMDRSRLPQIFGGMEQAMGLQAVKLYGVPESSRFALKLVAADYRLKRIALGHDASPVPELVNYMDLQAKRLTTGPQRQHRWWFVAGYDALHHSSDQLAWEFEGQGVSVKTAPTGAKSAAADNATNKGGKSSKAKEPQASPAASQFAVSCTRSFPKLAEKQPVFAELQNLVALSVAAELIAEQAPPADAVRDADAVAGNRAPAAFRPDVFLDAKRCPTQSAHVPGSVPSLTSYRLVDNRHWLISISGGVELVPSRVVGAEHRKESNRRALNEERARSRRPADNRWWWD